MIDFGHTPLCDHWKSVQSSERPFNTRAEILVGDAKVQGRHTVRNLMNGCYGMKRVVSAFMIVGILSCVAHAQQIVEEFDFVDSVTESSTVFDTFASLDIPPVAVLPDIPGYVVENMRVELTINHAIFNVHTSGGSGSGFIAGSVISGMGFGVGSYHTEPPRLLFFDGIHITTTTYPPTVMGGDSPWPAVIVYEFSQGNIPEVMGFFGHINAFAGTGSPTGSATLSVDLHIKVTYNVGPTTFVRLLDVSDYIERGMGTYSTAMEIQTVEVPESTLDNHEPVGVATEVTGTVLVYRDGLGQGPPEQVIVGTPVFQNDVIETQEDASVDLSFIDETSFTMSESARLAIDEYVFDPAVHEGEPAFNVLKGVFIYTQGLIGREDSAETEEWAPYGSLGIRGRQPGPVQFSTQEFVRPFDARTDPFQIGFDYAFVDEHMTMDVLLDNILVGTFSRAVGEPDPTDFTHAVIDIDDENGILLGPVELRFKVTGPVGSEFLIDNVTGPSFTDPGFDYGFGPWFTRGDGEMAFAGVVYDELCLGNRDFDRGTGISVPSDPLDMVKGDVNLDGKPDIVVLTGDPFGNGGPTAITVMLGDGQGGFNNATDYPLEAHATRVVLHDVTGDIYPDILFLSDSGNQPTPTSYFNGINLMVNDGASGFSAPITITPNQPGQSPVNSFTIADVNNDQVLDIPFFTGDGIEFKVLIGEGNGVFSMPSSGLFLGFQIGSAMISGDFDEDGDQDVAIGYSTGNVELLMNNGNGVFARGDVLTANSDVRQIIADDFDADGHLDLAVRLWVQSPSAIHIFKGDGQGGFIPSQQLFNSLSIFDRKTQMEVGDIDNDGDRDIVVMSTESNSLTRLVNNGSGSFTEERISGIGTPFFAHGRGMVLIDVDRNGSLDIVGDDGFNQSISLFTAQCQVPCTADLTNDGILDFFDISLFLTHFSNQDPIADFTNDNIWDFFDVSSFLSAFTDGCP